MAQKLKLTKNQLKKEKDSLKMFQRYLPMLQLKKQQLQSELFKLRKQISTKEKEKESRRHAVSAWVDVFGAGSLEGWVGLKRIETIQSNIAGVDMPLFKNAVIEKKEYDFMEVPLWVDFAIKAAEEMLILQAEILVLRRQEEIIKEELRIATQRVNLFEKVMIPRTQDNIRKIRIHLGDLQTAEVVRGKIAKAKTEKRREVLKI